MKANVDFVSTAVFGGSRAFFVWNKRADDFEKRNGNGRWEFWDSFLADLRTDLSTNPDISAREQERIVAGYIAACPDYIKRVFSPIKPESRTKRLGSLLFGLGLAAFLVWIIGYAVWDGLAKPALGSLGLIEYKSKTQIRYEKFLQSVSGCRKDKTIMAGNGSLDPAFELYVCADGEEKIWSRKVEVVRKVAGNKWVIE